MFDGHIESVLLKEAFFFGNVRADKRQIGLRFVARHESHGDESRFSLDASTRLSASLGGWFWCNGYFRRDGG